LITIALASIRQLVTSPRIYAKKGTTSNSRSLKLCVYFLDKGTGLPVFGEIGNKTWPIFQDV
ncbi:hypothetical protein, partial [Paenibacillus cymbidii]|uniref:hypothetical protein n=1 Tax=Paenibacillus cymbidii TaxID=1639034 RepID=UPI001A9B5A90